MRIERQDKQPEPNEEEVQNNWKAWARRNNFMQVNPVFVEAGELGVSLEVWESESGGEAGLVYLPRIPRATVGGDVLYIADNVNEMLETVKQLTVSALIMVQVKSEQQEDRARLN